MGYKVKEVADLVGISVRTLHYYDQIDLLSPKYVTDSGYRIYTDEDLEMLQQILFFKELDFSLQDIKEILESEHFDRMHALQAHKLMLLEKYKRLATIIETVEKTIATYRGGTTMSNKERFEGFNMAKLEEHRGKYVEEVQQKYGNTDAYRESQQKTSTYSQEDWVRITKKGNDIYKEIAEQMDKGPTHPDVQALIASYRQYITDNFYNCTPEIYRGLADMYIVDERFAKNINKAHEGLAQFLSEAIHAYCDAL
ncbi:MerR family transcriptional regulator [Bacillus sp. HMF5848]|uniref:MerR family transcriptional regulator n=1 Tax=Bacillus sp. HMF5848 TaxID=2495421 RepID=UPI000F76CD0D|nr:MerR family transcriptional regulator [Bacillus sp. HMF5848]RSK29085.1 MerR family transcriptional regulator [Bacillus sp. HMF5848]